MVDAPGIFFRFEPAGRIKLMDAVIARKHIHFLDKYIET